MMTKEEIYEKADRYLILNVGNLVSPGEPLFDKKVNVWIVPLFHRSKVATFPLGEMIMAEDGDILYAPNTQEMEDIGEKKLADVEGKSKEVVEKIKHEVAPSV